MSGVSIKTYCVKVFNEEVVEGKEWEEEAGKEMY